MFRSGRRSKPGVARMPRVNPALGNRSGVNMSAVRATARRIHTKHAKVIEHTGSRYRGEARHYGVTRRNENYGTMLLNDVEDQPFFTAYAPQDITVTPTPNETIEVIGKVINPLPFPQYVCLHTGALQAAMVGIIDSADGTFYTCYLNYTEIPEVREPCRESAGASFDVTLYTPPDVRPIGPQPMFALTGALASVKPIDAGVLADPIDGGDTADVAGKLHVDNATVPDAFPLNAIEGGKP